MQNNVFQFRDRKVTTNIAGQVFTFENTPELGETIKGYSLKGIDLAKEMRAGEKTDADAMSYCRETIDGILGTDAFNRIFSERAPNFPDSIDIINYLAGLIRKSNATPANRSQRRAKKSG